MDLGPIINTLHGLRVRAASLAAEGFEEAQAQIVKLYQDLGYSASLVRGRTGILIGAIRTNILQIIGDTGFVHMTMEPEPNAQVDGVAVSLTQQTFYDKSGNRDLHVRVKPSSVAVETEASFPLVEASGSKNGANYTGSFSVANPLGISLLALANELQASLDISHAIVGLRRIANLVDDTKAQQSIESGTIRTLSLISEFLNLAAKSVTHGARVAELRADPTNATLSLTNGSNTATITQAQITILNALISGTVTLSALTASRPLKLNGSLGIISQLINLADATNEVTGAVGIVNGGTNATSEANARTNLDVYSKAEVDTLLAGKSDVGHTHTMSATGGHTHGGAVASDGVHAHVIT